MAPIEADAVTVSARGDQTRLAVGDSASVGGVSVTLVSVDGAAVELVVRRG